MSKAHTVIAILEAKKGKEQELKQALIEVIAPSRNELTCLEFRLHQAKNNTQQFII
jgi:quinol monooxygenase YgiN